MITQSDSLNTVDLGAYYAILPTAAAYTIDQYCQKTGARRVSQQFSYDSGSNERFLSVGELRTLIAEHVQDGGQGS
jgi:hypothetical protein